ncbi:MAG: zinc-binding alcohol dehydrogenase family protein [Spirochaetales bacterium]|nr:zinc-binding alcohol dehydrogenase family protein [Spirochaetales bacterium]
MKVLQVIKPGEIAVTNKEIGKLKAGEVIVDIKRVGICGSDIHIFKGSNPFTVYPRVIGHEMTGLIAEIAPDVQGVRAGDGVVIDPVLNCGVCDACRRGHPNVCGSLKVMGVHADGGFASQMIVPSANVYKVPETMSWNKAVLVEPFSIGANICDRTGVEKGDRVLVLGSGVIGNAALMTAKMLGAEVIVCDIDDAKLEKAKELGADHTINSIELDLQEEVFRLTKGEGVTVVIDAACVPALFQSLLECAAPGGRIGVLGFSKDFSEINQFEITRKELSIVGSRLNNRRFPQVIRWFEDGLLEPEKLINSVHSFADAERVLREIASTGVNSGKTIIRLD